MKLDRDTCYAIFKILSETIIKDRILMAVRSDMTSYAVVEEVFRYIT